MAYVQINNSVPHYHTDDGSLASGYVIKAYLEGTSTATNLYTDSAGTSAGTSIALNARGEPEVSGNTIIPYFDDSIIYKLSLYPTQAAADADTGAEWSIDGINPAASVSSLKFIGQYSDNLATAISDIGSTETTLWIDKSISVTEDATVPATLALKFLRSGDLNISATKTVTVNGPIDAGNHQIFAGAGTVALKGVYNPVWVGEAVDGATDNTTAIQEAIDAQKAGETVVIEHIAGTAVISTIDLDAAIDLTLKGVARALWTTVPHGAVLECNSSGANMIDFTPAGSIVNARITLEDLFLDGNSNAQDGLRFDNFSVIALRRIIIMTMSRYGMNLGDTNSSFGADLEDCYVNAATTAAYRINARHVFMRGCRSDGGLYGADIGSAGGQSELIGNHLEGASTANVRITSAAGCRIIGNNLPSPSASPTVVLISGSGGNANIIASNRLSTDGGAGSIGINFQSGANLAADNVIDDVETGVKLESSQNAVIGNYINAGTVGVTESSPGGANVIIGNIVAGGVVTPANDETVVMGNFQAHDQKRKYAATLAAGDINDYDPSTYGELWFLAADGAGTTKITGIAGGVRGRTLTITNISANNLTIAYASSSSLAANRILDPSKADIVIPEYGVVVLNYDATGSRWYVASKNIA